MGLQHGCHAPASATSVATAAPDIQPRPASFLQRLMPFPLSFLIISRLASREWAEVVQNMCNAFVDCVSPTSICLSCWVCLCRGFADLVLYVEACESGSIFEGLLDDSLNIYVTTAANAHESSWGTYCPGMEPAPPTEFSTCLGDLYSVAFLENW